jgi:hypothetical protein
MFTASRDISLLIVSKTLTDIFYHRFILIVSGSLALLGFSAFSLLLNLTNRNRINLSVTFASRRYLISSSKPRDAKLKLTIKEADSQEFIFCYGKCRDR